MATIAARRESAATAVESLGGRWPHRKTGSKDDRAFQLELVQLQVAQAHEVTFDAAFFSVGASFEVFSLTILLTAVLLKGDISPLIWVLVGFYFVTGIFFVAYASFRFRRTRRSREADLARLAAKFL